jgi:hypothetical protein
LAQNANSLDVLNQKPKEGGGAPRHHPLLVFDVFLYK